MKTKMNLLMVLALLVILAGMNTGPALAQVAITIGPDTLAKAEYYTQYSQELTASGGTEPYAFSLVDGSLPSGITLTSSGLLSGFAAGTPGTYPITVQVVDANGVTATHAYDLVLDKGTPTVTARGQNFIYWNRPFMVWAEVKKLYGPGAALLLDGTVAFFIDGEPVPGCAAVTKTDGQFVCSGVSMDLGLGDHTVRADYTPTGSFETDFYPASGSGTFTVQPGAYTVAGQLFRDLDQDGVYDADEYSLGKTWTVNLDQDCDGTANYSLTTDQFYSSFYFYNIPGGHCYRYAVISELGWKQTTQPEGFWLSSTPSPVAIGFYYPTITVSPSSLPSGSVGIEYSQQFSASGGAGSYTYTPTDGNLPDGLTLSEAGVLSGTPTAAGIFSLGFQAEDTNGAAGTKYYLLKITTDAVFTFTSSVNPSATGEAVTFTLTATGQAQHYYAGLIPPAGKVTFFAGGTPIEGCSDLNLNLLEGRYGDYPATCKTAALGTGSHEITATFTDFAGIFNTTSLALTQQVGQPSSYTISGSIFLDDNRDGGKDEGESTLYSSGPVYLNQGCDDTVDDYTTWLADGGYAFSGLPGGECYRITVEIGESGMKQYTELADFTLNGDVQIDIGFNYPPITITPPSGTEAIPAELPSGNVGVAYYQEFAASGGAEPYVYQIVKSYLPDGLTLTLSEDGGVLVLSGTPTVGGLYGFEVGVWDANGAPLLDAYGYPASAYYLLVIKTDAAFTFISSANPSAAIEAVIFTVSATGNAIILQDPMPPVGWVTFSADGTPIEGCSDLLLNVGASGPGYNPVTCTTAALEAGSHQITATYTDAIETMIGYRVYNTPTLALTQVVSMPTPQFQSTGFTAPVDLGSVLNAAKAGQMIPLKWRLLDGSGNPVTDLDPASVTLTASGYTCQAGIPTDGIETYGSGTSALQNLGDGYYQLNWKTEKAYASSCKQISLNIGTWTSDGLTALFKFTR